MGIVTLSVSAAAFGCEEQVEGSVVIQRVASKARRWLHGQMPLLSFSTYLTLCQFETDSSGTDLFSLIFLYGESVGIKLHVLGCFGRTSDEVLF